MKSVLRLFAVLVLALPCMAMGQNAYPQKPITLIVPFGPGGGVDNFARPLAQKLSQELNQKVLIENRAGAGGTIGIAAAANAAPDGYTLLASTDTSVYLTTQVVKGAKYDPIKDLEPIISAAITPTVIVAHSSLPVHTVKELVEYAKKSPTPLPYVTAGVGSLHHLTGETLALETGAPLLHVAYRGGSAALTDLLGGQVKAGLVILSVVAPHIESGKLRALAVIEDHRSANYPDIPTISESGIPGFAMPDTSIAIWGPAGIPQDIVKRINAAVQNAMKSPEIIQSLKKGGYEATPGTPEAFREQAVKSHALYKRLVEQTKIAQ